MSQKEEQFERKRRAMKLMATGVSWKEANEQCGLTYTRWGIQKLYQRWLERGDEVLNDHRHGHPYKATEEVREWMKEYCPEDPEVRAPQLASEIEAQFGVALNPNYVTHLRRQLELPVPKPGRPSRLPATELAPVVEPEPDFSPCQRGGSASAL